MVPTHRPKLPPKVTQPLHEGYIPQISLGVMSGLGVVEALKEDTSTVLTTSELACYLSRRTNQ